MALNNKPIPQPNTKRVPSERERRGAGGGGGGEPIEFAEARRCHKLLEGNNDFMLGEGVDVHQSFYLSLGGWNQRQHGDPGTVRKGEAPHKFAEMGGVRLAGKIHNKVILTRVPSIGQLLENLHHGGSLQKVIMKVFAISEKKKEANFITG